MKVRKWLLAIAVLGLIIPPGFAKADADLGAAKTYLLAHANNPWSTMALSALSESSIPQEYLKTISGTGAIDYAAPILAITSLGQDPRSFGSEDYIVKLKSFDQNSQLGDTSTVNDDIFGLLALISAGEGASNEAGNAKNFILTHQGADGGWGFATGGTSDSNMTSTAIVALTATGLSPSDTHIINALNYLKTAQNDDGGFTYDPQSTYGTGSDSSSTAWGLWAIKSVGQTDSSWTKAGKTPTDFLNGQQSDSGWFKYQENTTEDTFSATTTAYAAIALLNKTLPLRIVPAPGGGGGGGGGGDSKPYTFRIEGSTSTVCEGGTDAPNALEVVIQASKTCGFSYHIKQTGFGPYLDQIEDDLSSGTKGWMYLVNYQSPSVGASDYQLHQGDSVIWYFGNFDWLPTRLSLENTTLSSGQSIKAKVEFLKDNTWAPLENANTYAGTTQVQTDPSGQATISTSDGYYKVFAEKNGYIRSNGIGAKVGDAINNEVALSVNVVLGQVNGDSIAFTVSPNNADFGTLKKGESKEKKILISNTGQSPIIVETQVSGDSLFVDRLTLNDAAWQTFKASVGQGANKDANLKLNVPSSYSGTAGSKNGKVIFWATAQ